MTDLTPGEVGSILLNSLSTRTTDSEQESVEVSFPERLKQLIGGQSIRAFARECGLSDTTLRQYLSGQSEPTRPALIAIARAAHVSLDWLICGEGDTNEVLHQILDSLHIFKGNVKDIAFSKDWLKEEFPHASESLMLFYMPDDSMENTIKQNDLLLVDAGVKDIQSVTAGIYLLKLFGVLSIKRLQKVGSTTIKILSDNSLYESFLIDSSELEQDNALIGQVLWHSRKLV
jgi:transcriptional regulator with XRE-family HTH domain